MTAYERLVAAAQKASDDAKLQALRTVRAVYWECKTIESEWADRTGPEADAARAVLTRIRATLNVSTPSDA